MKSQLPEPEKPKKEKGGSVKCCTPIWQYSAALGTGSLAYRPEHEEEDLKD